MLNRGPALSLHSNLPLDNTSSSSEDEEDRLRREEEEEAEQERLLSRQYGEASEGRGGGRKRTNISINNQRKRSHQQTDAEIIDALNSTKGVNAGSTKTNADGTTTSIDEGSKTKRIKRAVLNEAKLTGSKGLIHVRREFPTRVQYKEPKRLSLKDIQQRRNNSNDKRRTNHKKSKSSSELKRALKRKQFELDVRASATYVSKLMNAYHSFATSIAPNMHPIDTFRKIETLGSKRQVRDYLDTMREEVCKDHLRTIYGNDRAEKLVDELEDGLKAHQDMILDGGHHDDIVSGRHKNNNGDIGTPNNGGGIVTSNNSRATRNVGILLGNNDDDDKSQEEEEQRSKNTKIMPDQTNRESDIVEENPSKKNDEGITAQNRNEENGEDSDGEVENEATFDDIVGEFNQSKQDENSKVNEGNDDPGSDMVKDKGNATSNINSPLGNEKDEPNAKGNAQCADESTESDINRRMEKGIEKLTPMTRDCIPTIEEGNQITDDDKLEPKKPLQENVVQDEDINEKNKKNDEVNDKEIDKTHQSQTSEENTYTFDTQPEQEHSMIVEFTPSQEIDNNEDLVVDSSQSLGGRNTDMPAMTQNTLSQFEDTNIDEYGMIDSERKAQEQCDETQTVIPTMTPTDFISQEY